MIAATRTLGRREARYVETGQWDGQLLTTWTEPPGGPSQAAIVDGDTTLSLHDLGQRRDALAAGLAGRGIGRGAVVSVELPNWWETAALMHATLAAGGIVNPIVPIYRDAELGFILRQAGSAVLCIPHRFRGFDYVAMAERVLDRLDSPPLVVVARPEGPLPAGFVGMDQLLAEGAPGRPAPPARSSDICLLLYTSGTTADPKGVLHSHDTLRYEIRSIVELFGLDAADTVFMPSPLTHITGFLFGVLLPTVTGCSAVYLDVWDPSTAADLIETHQCRFTMAATPFLQDLVATYEQRGVTCALRAFPCGGADVPPDLIRRARRTLGGAVMRVYGSSEFPTYSCSAPGDDEWIAAETDGRPIGAVEHRLSLEQSSSQQSSSQQSSSEAAELLVRGPELFLGYLDAELNATAFDEDGWFRTGDLATEDGGAITIRGRRKDIIIRGGENLSAKQIEDHLYRHRSVREVAVVAMPDPVMGEKACAFVVPEGPAPTLADLAAWLSECGLARQKCPERVEIVDELPKTPSGKVQKFVLRQRIKDLLAGG